MIRQTLVATLLLTTLVACQRSADPPSEGAAPAPAAPAADAGAPAQDAAGDAPPQAPDDELQRKVNAQLLEVVREQLRASVQAAEADLSETAAAVHLDDSSPRIDLPETLPTTSNVVYMQGAGMRVPFDARSVALEVYNGTTTLHLDYDNLKIDVLDFSVSDRPKQQAAHLLEGSALDWGLLAIDVEAQMMLWADEQDVPSERVAIALRGYSSAWAEMDARFAGLADDPLGLYREALSATHQQLDEAATGQALYDAARRLKLRAAVLTYGPKAAKGGPELIVSGPTLGLAWGGKRRTPLLFTMAGPGGMRVDIRIVGDLQRKEIIDAVVGSLRPIERRPEEIAELSARAEAETVPVRRAVDRIALLHLDPTPQRAEHLLSEMALGGMPKLPPPQLDRLVRGLGEFTNADAASQKRMREAGAQR